MSKKKSTVKILKKKKCKEEQPIYLHKIILSKSLWTVTAAMKLKDACSLEEKL